MTNVAIDLPRVGTPPHTTQRMLPDVFRECVSKSPNKTLLTFVGEDGSDEESLTYSKLAAAADDIAAYLHGHCGLKRGARAVLVYPPSMDFVRAFLGCLVAGTIPVPVCPPDPFGRDLTRLQTMFSSCGASAILSNEEYTRAKQLGAIRRFFLRDTDVWPDISWYRTDNVPHSRADLLEQWTPQPDDIAFLQYTSGSTSMPKGVVITYANLAHQLACNAATLDFNGDVRAVFWVPHYHDLGLISGILSSIQGNGHLYLMSPLTFLRNPALWPELMSRVRATHTAAPNFGYELVVRKTTEAQRARWDLSSLRIALNAGESVRETTLRQFVQSFSVSGFRAEALNPVYGLAEHTVGVTFGGGTVLRLNRDALEQDRVELLDDQDKVLDGRSIAVIGCGKPFADVRLCVVNPETRAQCPNWQVGEIWVDSPSKAAGYYCLETETRESFQAKILGNDDQTEYLRTGDLGFMLNGELFVTGRLKDAIIIRGRNYYAEDIEESVRRGHPNIRPGGIAAFSVTDDFSSERVADERIVVFAEIGADVLTDAEANEISYAIAQTVWRDHSQVCRVVVLGKRGLVAKTSSGKIQRRACRSRFLRNRGKRKDIIHIKHFDPENFLAKDPSSKSANPLVISPDPSGQRRPEILSVTVVRNYLISSIAKKLGIPPGEVEPSTPLGIYSIDSLKQAEILGGLSNWVGWNVEPNVVLQQPTIADIAQYIVDNDASRQQNTEKE